MKIYYAMYNNNGEYEDFIEWVGDFGYLRKEKCEAELRENGFEFYKSSPDQTGHCIEVWRKLILPKRKSIYGIYDNYEYAELCVLEVIE